MITVTEKAYAKINLFLDVISRREDGFHDIETVMQTVSLYDTVSLAVDSAEKTDIIISVVNNPTIPTNEKSLIYKAINRFLDKAALTCHVEAVLTSNIPTEAGLAGGSADAAAALRAVAKVFDNPLTDSEMLGIASEIGSDVAFCYAGGCALCKGRGEIMTPLKNYRELSLVIAKGKVGMSTPRAYSALDGVYSDFDGTHPTDGAKYRDSLLSAIDNSQPISEYLYNVFESVVIPEVPDINKIKSVMINNGACAAMMTGSGTAVFGIYSTDCDRERTVEALRALGYFAESCTSIC